MSNCPVDGKCPECGGDLTREEDQGEDTLQYCGPACEDCGWEHCGGCV